MREPYMPHIGKYLRDRYTELDAEKTAAVREGLRAYAEKNAGLWDSIKGGWGALTGAAKAVDKSPGMNALSTVAGVGAPDGGGAFGPAAKMTPQAQVQSNAFEQAKIDRPSAAAGVAKMDMSNRPGGLPQGMPGVAPAMPAMPGIPKPKAIKPLGK